MHYIGVLTDHGVTDPEGGLRVVYEYNSEFPEFMFPFGLESDDQIEYFDDDKVTIYFYSPDEPMTETRPKNSNLTDKIM